MRIAILSDIHSNCFALRAVIRDLHQYGIEKIIVLGDIFGYYPWANDTYELLLPYLNDSYFIKGNHDQLLLDHSPPIPIPSYWQAVKQNEAELRAKNPIVLKWLEKLDFEAHITINNISLRLIHGIPGDTGNGRYYPDDRSFYEWLPKNGEILLLGHTHYPLLRYTEKKGIIFNPGSVGQPRDANPMPSWGILDIAHMNFQFVRSNYDPVKAMRILEKMQWEPRAIAALNKTEKGTLKFDE